MGREQVRQVQCAGLASLGILQLAADGGAVGHVGHVEQDALLSAHRVVELGQQAVHRRVGLFTVHMPDAEHGGVLGRKQGLAAAAARKDQTGEDCRKLQKCPSSNFHDSFPHIAARGGKPAQAGLQLPVLVGNTPKSPQFWAFWGDFLRGKPQNPKNFFGIAPQKRLF